VQRSETVKRVLYNLSENLHQTVSVSTTRAHERVPPTYCKTEVPAKRRCNKELEKFYGGCMEKVAGYTRSSPEVVEADCWWWLRSQQLRVSAAVGEILYSNEGE
jgi:hypothetical protein